MRLFVALEVPRQVRENIAAAQRNLRDSGAELTWVRSENFHVTLKFIGEASTEELPAITQVLREVRPHGAVKAHFRGLGHSWHARRGGVLWVNVDASDGLKMLASQINRRLQHLGVPPDERAFLPHLTLARFKRGHALPAVRAAVNEYAGREFGSMHAGEFHLIASKLGPGGSQYSTLSSFQFTMAAPA